MKALFLTNEYPPHVYGGAGVHVDYLVARAGEIDGGRGALLSAIRSRQDTNPAVRGFELDAARLHLSETVALGLRRGPALPRFQHQQRSRRTSCIVTPGTAISAGFSAKLNYGLPLVITVHSLEPLRPWKREQLGGGYDFTVWLEKTALEMADAVIAVSNETKADIERLFQDRSVAAACDL